MREQKETMAEAEGFKIAAETLRDAGLDDNNLYLTVVGPGMILILGGQDFVADEAFLEKFLSLRKQDAPQFDQSL